MFIIMRHLIVLIILSLLACAAPPPPPPSPPPEPAIPDPFPTPLGLEPQVNFWIKVYSEWSQAQVALHDDRYMDVVYKVIQLPGPVTDAYSREDRRYVREQRKFLKQQLAELEKNHRNNLPLPPYQQSLANIIKDKAGEHAIWGAAERLRSQRGLRERFQRGLSISGRYLPAFRTAFRQAGLPEDLALLPHVESSFQAHARSSVGATGMWQFTRGAARIFMTDHPAVDERLDPVASAKGAARYLKTAFGYLQSWPLALTSYNHGIGSMRTARERFGTDFMQIVRYYDRPSFGFASRNFYAEFLAARAIALNPEQYFPGPMIFQPALKQDSIVLAETVYAGQLARHFGMSKFDLAALNPAWTRAAVNDRISLPPGLTVWLPSGAVARNDAINQVRIADDSSLPAAPISQIE